MGTAPHLAIYQGLRRHVSSILPVFELHLLILQTPVPTPTLDHPVVQHLRHMLADYFAWTNDLLSLRRELEDGSATVNLAMVLREELSAGLQQGVNTAAIAIRELAAAYLALKARLPALGLDHPSLLAHLDQLEHLLADVIQAARGLPRYALTESTTTAVGG